MKVRERIRGFEPRSLKIAAAAAEVARATGMDITVDLFCPRRACYRCAQKAEVFIGPNHVCASCWVQLVTRYSGAGANGVRAQLPAITAALANPAAA